MDRLYQLKKTLPINVNDNIDFGNVEFAILDYGSTDGLEHWVKNELSTLINNGIVSYYRFEADTYHRSHSRNMIFKLAAGDILCNLDADNYTGKNFADFIHQSFVNHSNCFLSVDTSGKIKVKTDVIGRICMLKRDFLKIGGYDERLEGYGFEDYDICNRLENLGRKKILISNDNFLKAEEHGDEERYKNEYNFKKLRYAYLRYIDHQNTQLLLTFKDKTFRLVNLYDSIYDHRDNLLKIRESYFFQFKQFKWFKGSYILDNDVINLHFEGSEELSLVCKTSARTRILTDDPALSTTFFLLKDRNKQFFLLKKIVKLLNNDIMMLNKIHQKVEVNPDGLGMGRVIKNFGKANEITL